MKKQNDSSSRVHSLCCSNISDSNLRELLEDIPFEFVQKKEDYEQKLCPHTHKNLNWRVAPLLPQFFTLQLSNQNNIKYLVVDNLANGCQMTISIAEYAQGPFVQVYKQKYICKGKELKGGQKTIDLGALPCRAIKIHITRGIHISSKAIRLIGCPSEKIQERLGSDYFKLLVLNPKKIIYS